MLFLIPNILLAWLANQIAAFFVWLTGAEACCTHENEDGGHYR